MKKMEEAEIEKRQAAEAAAAAAADKPDTQTGICVNIDIFPFTSN